MWCKKKSVIIKIISLTLITVLFIAINSSTSFAKILTINWNEIKFHVPNL